jgi:sugar transferase EpsL
MRLLDMLLSILLIILTVPLMLFTALLIVCCHGWPVLYSSVRIGMGGKPYRHRKFRTMRPGPTVGRVFFEKQRLTSTGRFLRRFHLDELPELFLILQGKMSFTGPRPLPAGLLQGLDTTVRQQVPPGWTGPAQIYLARRGILDKRLQIRLDEHYVQRRSLTYNVKLLAATVCVMFRAARPNMEEDASKDRIRFAEKSRGLHE